MCFDKAVLLAVLMSALAAIPTKAFSGEEGWLGLNAVEAETSGFFLSPRVESLTLREVAPGSPAAGQRLEAGDVVLKIDGVVVKGAKARTLHSLLDKTVGATTKLVLQRQDGTEYEAILVAVEKPVRSAK